MAELCDGDTNRRIDGEAEPRGERDRPEHADRVFLKPDERVADRAHDAGAQIVEAADVIDDRKRRDVVEQRVDGEIAAEGVFFRGPKRVVAMEEMLVGVRYRRLMIQVV